MLDAVPQGETLNLTLRMAAGITLNINPTLLLNAFFKHAELEPQGVRIERQRILTADLRDFI